jgi:gluconate 2-dehydrogenase gamma chain
LRITRPNKKRSVEDIDTSFSLPDLNTINRRAFLKTGINASLLSSLIACKPSVPELEKEKKAKPFQNNFSQEQLKTLDAVQIQLFPDDGNGPSAREINALSYLESALKDPRNIKDGDPDFILKGIGWLDDLANKTQGDDFVKLNATEQDKLLKKIAQSKSGKNWLSLLLYYLTEALMLDPIYGANPDQVGWQWLEHQAGYPRPEAGKTFRDFD